MRVAVGYQKTVDDIEIGNSSAIGSPMSSRRSQVPFLPPSSRFWIRSSSFYRYPRPSSAARDLPSRSPSHPRSAIRVRVSAVRLEHVPTFLFFMCTTPRAMGIPSYYLYRRCDFSFPYSPLSFPPSPPRVHKYHHRCRFPCPFPPPMGIYGYRISIEVHETSPRPLPLLCSAYIRIHTHARASRSHTCTTYAYSLSLSLS